MFEIYYIIFVFFFSVFCFFELIIFNEEILLTLCFLCFLFFIFNSIGNSIFDNLKNHASKIENDLFISFVANKKMVLANFYKNDITTTFKLKFSIVEALCLEYFHVYGLFFNFSIHDFFNVNAKSMLLNFLRSEQKLQMASNKVSIRNFLYTLFYTNVINVVENKQVLP